MCWKFIADQKSLLMEKLSRILQNYFYRFEQNGTILARILVHTVILLVERKMK